MEKIGSLRKYNYNGFTTTVGTVNKSGACIYVNLGAWITTDKGLKSAMDGIKRRLRNKNIQLIDVYFDGAVSKYITDLDYAESKPSQKPNMTSFFSIEVTLFGKLDWKDENLHWTLENYGRSLYEIITSCDDLIITPTRKG